MNRFYILLLISVMLLFAACRPEQKGPGMERIAVALELSKDVSIFDVCSGIELTPLETSDSALLSIIYVKPYQGEYYIKQNNPQQVFCFDTAGRLKFKIDNYGRGDEEYAGLSDIAVNPFSSSLFLLETLDHLDQYDLNGCFQNKFTLDSLKDNLRAVVPLNRDTLILVSGRNNFVYSFFSLRSGKVIASHKDPMPMAGSVSPFFHDRGKVYHYNWYDNVIYRVEGTSFIPAFYLDFGKSNNKLGDTLSGKIFSNDTEVENYIKKFNVVIFNIQGNRDYLYLVLLDNTTSVPVFKRVLYHKKNKQSFVFENFKEKVNWNFFDNLADSYFISTVNAANKEELLDARLLDEANRKVYETVDINDNPVIVRFKLK